MYAIFAASFTNTRYNMQFFIIQGGRQRLYEIAAARPPRIVHYIVADLPGIDYEADTYAHIRCNSLASLRRVVRLHISKRHTLAKTPQTPC
jgi:hypothetical protein